MPIASRYKGKPLQVFAVKSEFATLAEHKEAYESIKRHGQMTRANYSANCGAGGFPTFPPSSWFEKLVNFIST